MDEYIIALVGFLGGMVVLITPIIRLNGSITRLTTAVENLEKIVKEKPTSSTNVSRSTARKLTN